jgi:broad specificity phosphatase PhoE
MFEVLLVRHGQTDWNVERRVMGAKPIALNATGHSQVRTVAQLMQQTPLTAIATSPALRTVESAHIIAESHEGLVPVETQAFIEVDYGDWVGKHFSVFEDLLYNEYMHEPSTFQIPGGESITGMQSRAVAGIEALREAYPTGRCVVVSHADVIKAIYVHYMEVPLDRWHHYKIDNASITALRFEAARVRCLMLNFHPELGRLFGDDLVVRRS